MSRAPRREDLADLLPDSLAQELHALCLASLEGTASDADLSRLDHLICDNSAAQNYLARSLQTCNHLRLWAAAQKSAQPALQQISPGRRSPVLGFLNGLLHYGSETPVTSALMWLVMAVVCSGMVLTLFLCIALVLHGVGVHVHVDGSKVTKNTTGAETGRVEDGESGRDLQSPVLPISDPPRPSLATVARLIHIAAQPPQGVPCRWAIGSHSPHLGDDLEPGRKLVLLSGLAEVMFQSGVRVVLQGPATMEIGSRKSALLRQGKLTARIEDPDAHGFEVRTPGMIYTDLGTEFGVWVAKDGTQEMTVFRGTVQAESQISNLPLSPKLTGEMGNSPPFPASRSLPLILSAHQAIHVSGPDKPIERITANEKQFVRAMPGPEPFLLFGTGVGLDRGAADPHWEIVAVSTDPQFKPRSAMVVFERFYRYASDSRDAGQWVALEAKSPGYPDGCRWVFRTKFDLNGFDPDTARIDGQFVVDDWVDEVRLNGRPLPLADRGEYTRMHPITIENGFVAGANVLEIAIVNRKQGGPGANKMGLCVQWKGTARRLARSD